MLGAALDVFRLRQYFDALTRSRELFGDLAHDIRFVAYPPEFAGEDQQGWRTRRASILYEASQVRTCQHAALARKTLAARFREHAEVVMIEPVPYQKVRGLGFYEQFLDTHEWGGFMAAGRRDARRALESVYQRQKVAG